MARENLSRAIDDLHKVLEISRSMAATTDLDALLNVIIERSMELLDAERATLFLYDADHNELFSRIAAGVDELRIPADKGISGAVVQTGNTINVPDAYADERFNPNVDRQTGFRTRNILTVPLKNYENRLVGVLQVLNKQQGSFNDYDITLAETLSAQAGVALQRAELISHYVEKLEMERAMKIAREIQRGLLPEHGPAVAGYDIAGFSDPADETGGDAYDFFTLPNDKIMLLVADASGHGIGPALVIAETRAMIRTLAQAGQLDDDLHNVATILQTVNKLLCQDLRESRFVTCFLGVVDPLAHTLTYASAGHGPLVFFDHCRDEFRLVNATGLPLGIMEDSEYGQPEVLTLEPEDAALVTTDGIFEATNPADECFGIQRMLNLLNRHHHEPAEEMIQHLHQAVLDFTEGLPQADDLTAIIVQRKTVSPY